MFPNEPRHQTISASVTYRGRVRELATTGISFFARTSDPKPSKVKRARYV
jgi:hypothetical protein